MQNIIDKIKYFRTKWTIKPSSKFLVRKMISNIDFNKNIKILQLWFGNWVFTHELKKHLSKNSSVTIFEIDKKCNIYSKNIENDNITYINDSAENLSKYWFTEKFDYILSTLPFASLPRNISNSIQDEIKLHLDEKWVFLQFQYSLHSRKDFTKLFWVNPIIKFELLNLPPAFIYKIDLWKWTTKK